MKDLTQIRIDNIKSVIDAHIKENPENKTRVDEILSLNAVFNPNFGNLYHLYEQNAIKELKILGLNFDEGDTLKEWKTAYRLTR